MSDSVTNVQIEDVLSSIRKLVSEEVRAQSKESRRPLVSRLNDEGDVHAEDTRQSFRQSDDRLLLTPALRVPPGSESSNDDEAPFTHVDHKSEEADLLDLMARVRDAGARHAAIERKRPAGIAAVERPAPAEPLAPATEEAIRSALFSLGDSVQASILGSDKTTPSAAEDESEEDSLSDNSALRYDERDTLAFAGRDDRVSDHLDMDDDIAVPKFLHRNGITSLGQRIAEVESVVSTSGGQWEPEADEDEEAAPGPHASAVPWDEPSVERDIIKAQIADEDEEPEDTGDWAVATDPAERDFLELPMKSRVVAQDAEDDAIPAATDDEDDVVLSAADREDDIDIHDDRSDSAVSARAEPADVAEPEMFASVREERAAPKPGAHIAAIPVEARFEAEEAYEDAVEEDEPEVEPARRVTVKRSEPEVAYDAYDDDREALVADDPTLFDEEMLRDLVSEIVRQELQGALGERITRNVRKLVRREIHRALSAHDLG